MSAPGLNGAAECALNTNRRGAALSRTRIALPLNDHAHARLARRSAAGNASHAIWTGLARLVTQVLPVAGTRSRVHEKPGLRLKCRIGLRAYLILDGVAASESAVSAIEHVGAPRARDLRREETSDREGGRHATPTTVTTATTVMRHVPMQGACIVSVRKSQALFRKSCRM